MSQLWARLVRWLAREHIAYLEYENKELRYEGERWRHRYEGAMDAVRVFERRYDYTWKAAVESTALKPTEPLVMDKRERQSKAEDRG